MSEEGSFAQHKFFCLFVFNFKSIKITWKGVVSKTGQSDIENLIFKNYIIYDIKNTLEAWCVPCSLRSTDNDFYYLQTQYSWFEVRTNAQAIHYKLGLTCLQTRLTMPNGSASLQGILVSWYDHMDNIIIKKIWTKGK